MCHKDVENMFKSRKINVSCSNHIHNMACFLRSHQKKKRKKRKEKTHSVNYRALSTWKP